MGNFVPPPKKNGQITLGLCLVGGYFLSYIEKSRNDVVEPRSSRQKELNVPASQSITEQDLIKPEGEEITKYNNRYKKKNRRGRIKERRDRKNNRTHHLKQILTFIVVLLQFVFSSDEEVYEQQPTKIRKRKLLNHKPVISSAAGIAEQNPVEENDQLKLVLPKSVENIGPVESFFYFKQ